MKYQKPYGAADANAPFVNGNPSIGLKGSIIPAEAIEHTQREIVNLISDTGLTPDDANLHQLALAIQTGKLIYAADTGSANSVIITLSRPPLAYVGGMEVNVKVAATNTAAATINVNALGAKAITQFDGSPLHARDLLAGCVVRLVYDGTAFQLLSPANNGQPVPLRAPRTYYVNAATGNDGNDGLTALTALATIQKAISLISLFNLNGYDITVVVADGTDTGGVTLFPTSGSGRVFLVGNTATPNNCVISTTNRSAIIGSNVGGAYSFNGFKVSAAGAAAGDAIAGCNIIGADSSVIMQNINWGSCVGAHMTAANGANITVAGAHTISGGCAGNSYIPGNHIQTSQGGTILTSASVRPSLTISAAVTFANSFAYATNISTISVNYTSITNPGNVAGTKYYATLNAVINTFGGGANYYPGTVAGSVSTGGQYI